MRERDKVKKKAIAKKNDQLWIEYRRLRNKVTFVIRKAKKQYYVDKLSECASRNQTWKILKSVLPNNNASSSLSCNDSYSKASEFNDHFAPLLLLLQIC